LEQLFNYALMHRMTIRQALYSGQYGPVTGSNRLPTSSLLSAGAAAGQKGLDALAKVYAGSNITDYATDQGIIYGPHPDPSAALYRSDPKYWNLHKVEGAWFSYHHEAGRKWAEEQRRRDAAAGGPGVVPSAGAGAGAGAGGAWGQIQAAIGDSIAEGVDMALGVKNRAGAFADAVSGTTPKQILARVAAHINDYAGKTIALASGSNPNAGFDESQMAAVKETMERLHKVGAHVVLLGVGQGVKDAGKINDRLAQIAKDLGDPFTGGLAGTERRGGVVHPDDYRKTLEQIRRVTPLGSTVKTAAAPEKTTVEQRVTINVHGNDSPSATAKQIKYTTDRSLAAMIHNNRGHLA
jgi:hypothetical protein